jgi:hypothetical protein
MQPNKGVIMKQKKLLVLSTLIGALLLSAGLALAAGQGQFYGGNQLMKERDQYRSQMRAAQTANEREQIRTEHRERAKARVRDHSPINPNELPIRGGGMNLDDGGMGLGGGGY